MKKLTVVAVFALLISCGPVKESPWPFYELVYSTTVQTHKYEKMLQQQLEELLNSQRNDSVFYEPEFLQAVSDSNRALLKRIDYAIQVLQNTPEDNDYDEPKAYAIKILKAQQTYQANSVYAFIRACEDGVLSSDERFIPAITRESYVTLTAEYTKWTAVRDEYIAGLDLSQAQLTDLKLRYGTD